MKYLSVFILAAWIFIAPTVHAAQTANATLSWDSNTESDISKYVLHMGTASGVYDTTLDVLHSSDAPRQTGKFLNLTEGQTYFFVATACDTSGNCSGFSKEVSKKIAIAPGVPGNLGVTVEINISLSLE